MYKIIFFISLIPTILVAIWFKDGYILGTAEDGLPFYNISHFKPEAEFAWMDHPGLGRSTLYLTASKPTYILLTYLQDNGTPGFILQACVLWLLLLSSGTGMYLLTQEFFPQLPRKYLILAVFFYWFNPISLVNVWNRFLLDYISFYSLLPIASFLFIRGLKSQKYIWSMILTLVVLFFSYSFNYLAFFILFWLILFLWTLFYFLVIKDGPSRLFYLKYFLLTLILFVLTNAWWISQLVGFQMLKDFTASIHDITTEINSGIFNALSKSMGNLSDIYRLSNASFFQKESLSWVRYYYSIPIVAAEFVITALIFYSIIRSRRDRAVLVLVGLFLTSIFLAKGNNPPLGEIFEFLFRNLIFLQIFRNPFEKSGLILSLVASPLLGFAIFKISEFWKFTFKKLIYGVILTYILIIWGYPFYTGLVFTSKFPPTNNYEIGYKVKVPKYYQQADDWLMKQGTNFRSVGFPIEDEGVTYKWEKGYSGVELSTALFTNTVILHKTGVPYFYDLVPEIQKTLLNDKEFYKFANLLNIRFMFVREDIDFQERKMVDPLIVKQKLNLMEQEGEIKRVAELGKLTFWENLKWEDLLFYPAHTVKFFEKQKPEDLPTIDASKGEVLSDRMFDLINSYNQIKDLKISYEKINPTKYMVRVQGSNAPFILIFSELFNNGWRAFIDEGENLEDHFRANYYANGWLVNRTGNFNIKVEFVLQKWLEMGEKISIVSFLILSSMLIYMLWRKKYKRGI